MKAIHEQNLVAAALVGVLAWSGAATAQEGTTTDAGTLDLQPSWLPVFRELGVNVAMMSDFHSDSHPKDPGPLRLKEQKVYFEGSQRHSDIDFLIMPGEEPNAYFGGHYTMDRIDAVAAVEFVAPSKVIPCHYDTFPPIQADADAFKNDVEMSTAAEVVILTPGETHSHSEL